MNIVVQAALPMIGCHAKDKCNTAICDAYAAKARHGEVKTGSVDKT
jgi:hypothetical protein